MDYEQILFEQCGHVGLITLNRPDKLNAWTPRMTVEMRDAIDRCVADATVGAVVVTGAGRAFCAGADISHFARGIESGSSADAAGDAAAVNWVAYCQAVPKPLIAAINGPAVGIGITQILPFDIRIAAESARIGMFFVKMAVVPELASSHLLPQLVGLGRALEWCLSGRMVGAAEAREAGLVSEVVADGELLDRALALGEQLGGQAVSAMARIKQLLVRNAGENDLATVLSREGAALAEAYASWEHREAVTAFFEKRPPNFTKA